MALFDSWFIKSRKYLANNSDTSNNKSETDNHTQVKTTSEADKPVETKTTEVLDIRTEVSKTAIDRFEKYVRQDFDSLGRADALTNPETNYIRLKLETIKADMYSMASSALLEIDQTLNKIDAWIEINNRFANIDTSRRLSAEKLFHQTSKDRILKFLSDLDSEDEIRPNDNTLFISTPVTDPNIETQLFILKNKGESRKLLLSYMSGAMRGVSTLSYLQFLRNTQ